MINFGYDCKLWAVVNPDGTFAGVPCLSWEEARELSAQHEGSVIFFMDLDCDQIWGEDDDPCEPFDDYLKCGIDPHAGCYDYEIVKED